MDSTNHTAQENETGLGASRPATLAQAIADLARLDPGEAPKAAEAIADRLGSALTPPAGEETPGGEGARDAPR